MSETYGHIQLQFEAEFSNAIIVHITCDAVLQKQLEINVEMDEQDLVSVVLIMSICCIVLFIVCCWLVGKIGVDREQGGRCLL